jgi:hypothetical protein
VRVAGYSLVGSRLVYSPVLGDCLDDVYSIHSRSSTDGLPLLLTLVILSRSLKSMAYLFLAYSASVISIRDVLKWVIAIEVSSPRPEKLNSGNDNADKGYNSKYNCNDFSGSQTTAPAIVRCRTWRMG